MMTASSRGRKTITTILYRMPKVRRSPVAHTHYLQNLVTRNFLATTIGYPISTTAAAAVEQNTITEDQVVPTSPSSLPINVPILSTKTHEIHSGVILSRPPLLTPELHPFEKAFFFYQKRLNERLAIPFTRYFYFKKDTPANTDWKIKIKERGGVLAKELGTYNAYGKYSWNDELLLREKHMVEQEYITSQLLKDARMSVTEDGVVIQDETARLEGVENPRPRKTDADKNQDVRRLDRLLDRTLYLVVRSRDTKLWGFPSGEVLGRENLHKAAERILAESCGLNMNTWIVGHTPIAYHIQPPPKRKSVNVDSSEEKNQLLPPTLKSKATFFMKGRIMAGQADLHDNYFDLDDFRWLTKEEVSQLVPSSLFSYTHNSMQGR